MMDTATLLYNDLTSGFSLFTTCNHFNFNLIDLEDVTDQLPCPFILVGDFSGHHTVRMRVGQY